MDLEHMDFVQQVLDLPEDELDAFLATLDPELICLLVHDIECVEGDAEHLRTLPEILRDAVSRMTEASEEDLNEARRRLREAFAQANPRPGLPADPRRRATMFRQAYAGNAPLVGGET